MPGEGTKFTSETGRLAQRASARNRRKEFKLLQRTLSNAKFGETVRLLTPILSNPAVIGTLLYLLVGALKQPDAAPSTSASILHSLVDAVGILTGNAGNAFLSGASTSAISNLDLEVLQAALLAYIASGGNLAGTFQGGANVLSAITALIPK